MLSRVESSKLGVTGYQAGFYCVLAGGGLSLCSDGRFVCLCVCLRVLVSSVARSNHLERCRLGRSNCGTRNIQASANSEAYQL